MMRRVVRAFGLVVAIRTDAPDLFNHLESQLPAFPADGSRDADLQYDVKVRSRGGLAVLRGRRTVATVPDVPAASVHLVMDLQTAIAGRAPGFTFVHAGVVGLGGKALLLPARSFAGKSTLVAALVGAGASYGSDEFAVIDAEGRVHAYSRQLALRTAHATRRVSPSELGGETLTTGLSPGAVLFTEFRSGASLEPRPLSSGEVVLRLLQHCLGVRGRPDETIASLRAVASQAPGFASLRGDADATAQLLVARARHGW